MSESQTGARERIHLSALDALPEHIAVLDSDGKIVTVNRAWREFAQANGYQAPDAGVGLSYLSACEGEQSPEEDTGVAEAIRAAAAGSDATFERRYDCHSRNELRWFRLRIAGFDDGDERRVMVSHEDITPMVQAELARDRADRARDEFLGLVSHELRTPITTIYGNARILRDRGDLVASPAGAEAMADVESEAARLRRLIDNMLALSRLAQGIDINPEPTLVRPTLERVVAKWERLSPARRFAIASNATLSPMTADAASTELVLDNLISNACESSPEDSVIEVEARQDDANIVVSVLDRGTGIEPGDETAIFEMFRKSGRRAQFSSGVGIGLTVCRRLVHAMRGGIWARSREGGGAQVSFTVPAATE